jgi:hypothetical protein
MPEQVFITETVETVLFQQSGDVALVEIPEITTVEIDEQDQVILADKQIELVETSEAQIALVTDTQIEIVDVAEQGPAGASAQEFFTAENKEAVQIKQGQIVATHSSGTGAVLASASNNSKQAVGLMLADTGPAASGSIQVGGTFEMSDWTNVTGGVTLAPKTIYYLDTSPGKLTPTPDETPGKIVQRVGRSVSTTKLKIEIAEAILL